MTFLSKSIKKKALEGIKFKQDLHILPSTNRKTRDQVHKNVRNDIYWQTTNYATWLFE